MDEKIVLERCPKFRAFEPAISSNSIAAGADHLTVLLSPEHTLSLINYKQQTGKKQWGVDTEGVP